MTGMRWFRYLCGEQQEGGGTGTEANLLQPGGVIMQPDPENPLPAADVFHLLVRKYVPVPLQPPFNDVQRQLATMPQEFYVPLARKADAVAQV